MRRGPSTPVEVLGLSRRTPEAGDRLGVVENGARAREVTGVSPEPAARQDAWRTRAGARGSLEQMMHRAVGAGENGCSLILIKGDVQGSVEAIVQALDKLGTEEVARADHACRRRRHHRIAM